MIELEHDIYIVDAQYMQPGVACLYLMRRGDQIAVVETGTTHSVPRILQALKTMGLSRDAVRYVIPTHIHLDHAGGAGALMELCPNAQLLVHPRGAPHMIDPEKLEAGTIAVYGEDKYRELYGELRPVPAERVTEVADGFELDFNGCTLSFVHTPGHALHHFCIHDSASRGIFTGDTFGLAYPNLYRNGKPFIFATTTPVHFSPDDMLSSIDRLLALQPKHMYLTHFGPIAPTPEVVAQLKQSILVFKDIALRHQQKQINRQAMIEQDLRAWLLRELDAEPSGETADWLANDVRLNAQGLEVWLRRLEKQASKSGNH